MNGNSEDIITIKRDELRSLMIVFAQEFARELGLKTRAVDAEWISKNQAVRINPKKFGRAKLEKAIVTGYVRKKPGQQQKRYSPILVNRRDVESCIKNQNI
jgi:hypothetical protein